MVKSSDTHEVLHEYQIKTTDDKYYAAEHQEKYEDIDLIVTDEVSKHMEDAKSSGFTNETITNQVETVSDNIANNTMTDRMVESGEYAGLVAAGFEAIKLIDGKTTLPVAGKQTIRTAANAAAATGITAFLFG